MKNDSKYGIVGGVLKMVTTIFSWTTLVLLVLAASFLAYYAISTKIYDKKGEKFEPIVSLYTIISPSMTPNINVYDVVVTKKIKSPDDIKTGDVITFTSTSSISRGMTITHRVIEIGKSEKGIAYKTKGDNNLSPDSAPAEYENVIGKVIFRIPQLGRLQEFIASKGGWLLLIVAPALFIVISDILKIFKLFGVKKKIDKIDTQKKEKIEVKQQKEKLRKEILKKQLIIDKNVLERDPIVIKKETRILVADAHKVNPEKEIKNTAKKTPKSNKKVTKKKAN